MSIEMTEAIAPLMGHYFETVVRLCICYGIDHHKLNEMSKSNLDSAVNEEIKVDENHCRSGKVGSDERT